MTLIGAIDVAVTRWIAPGLEYAEGPPTEVELGILKEMILCEVQPELRRVEAERDRYAVRLKLLEQRIGFASEVFTGKHDKIVGG